ncbi:hypothetical protein [Paracoccus sp. S1E-3]|uniref:hypothetical protein n=1 Tax=Paracoccus sp. S1E-3 TaxID=2756130 RepID=UPI0015EF8F60|nr:hypothetical protein [Paracoccus sp. S1E-3]MBA4491997.1 hypothetical protein [Paracoccus sp. S1E-3]
MLKTECTRNCWLAAALAGLLVFLFNLFGGGFMAGLLLGLMSFFLMGQLLVWLLCDGRGGVVESAEVLGPRATAHDIGDGGMLDRAEDAIVHAGTALASGTVSAVEKGREALHDMREDREKTRRESGNDDGRDGDDAGERSAEPSEKAGATASDAMGALAARGRTAQDSPAGEGAPAPAAGIAQASSTPEVTPLPASETVTPAKVKAKAKAKVAKTTAAKPAKAVDNLKEIKGVGPQLEKLLHDNGVISFAEIAAWSDGDIDHFAELIGRMGGRIRSDDWVGQAKILAAGQDTEFSRRVDKGEVY